MKIIDGGVTAAKGFKAASTAAEIKYKGRTDMAMVFSEWFTARNHVWQQELLLLIS